MNQHAAQALVQEAADLRKDGRMTEHDHEDDPEFKRIAARLLEEHGLQLSFFLEEDATWLLAKDAEGWVKHHVQVIW